MCFWFKRNYSHINPITSIITLVLRMYVCYVIPCLVVYCCICTNIYMPIRELLWTSCKDLSICVYIGYVSANNNHQEYCKRYNNTIINEHDSSYEMHQYHFFPTYVVFFVFLFFLSSFVTEFSLQPLNLSYLSFLS